MRIVFIEVKLLGNLGIGQVETHEVRTQNPDVQRLMMTGKNGVGQIVKASLTGLTRVALPLGLSLIAPLFGDLRTVAMGAHNAIRPAHSTDGGEAFSVVHQRLQVDHGSSIAHQPSPINWRRPPK
jgi:hypothetical protein